MHRSYWLVGLLGACCCLLTVACRSIDPLQATSDAVFASYFEAVDAAVVDPERAGALRALGRDVEAQLLREARALAGLRRRLAELNAQFDTPRAQLEAYLTAIAGRRQAIRDLLVAARLEAIGLTSPTEWAALQQRSDTFIEWFGGAPEQF